jgi:glycosyltransferase involved in cell wall biosynthesis
MRVLYLTQNPNRVSTNMPTEGWFRLLPAKGLEPVLVSNRSGGFQVWAHEQGIPAYEVPLPFPDKRRPFPFARALASVLRIARRHRIELVHSNEQDVYPIAQYVARVIGVPRVVSVHFTMQRGFCEWAFSGRKRPDRLIFTSRSNQEACRPSVEGVVSEDAWRVLRNGLNLQRYGADPLRRDDARRRLGVDGMPAIGVACALRPRKQLEHLFRAAGRLPMPVRVVVAGAPVAGDERYAQQLLDEGHRLLGDRLHVLGHIDDLRDFYNALDLFVNTSQEEACSLSVIESLASGCPVVGYASRSVDEQILPHGGEIVAQDDEDALVDAMERWLLEPDRLRAARVGARGQAEALFDIQTLADDLWNEYGGLLSGAASGHGR